MAKQVGVTLTPEGREAMRALAVLATTASSRKVSMSDAVVAALSVVRAHPDELGAALAAGEDTPR